MNQETTNDSSQQEIPSQGRHECEQLKEAHKKPAIQPKNGKESERIEEMAFQSSRVTEKALLRRMLRGQFVDQSPDGQIDHYKKKPDQIIIVENE